MTLIRDSKKQEIFWLEGHH